jgi:predicted O-linked N-acetylglucosamine transferase (SPINDLY family)
MLSKLRALLKSKGPTSAAWQAQFQQAQALQRDGKLEQAIELYSRCIEESPLEAEPYYKRANALNTLGRLGPALEDYNSALSADPSYAYAACNRGSVLQRLGRNAEALESLDLALRLNPSDAYAHYNRGSVLKDLERCEEALQAYEAAIGLNSNFAAAFVNRGGVLQNLQRNEAALESFQRALTLNPTLAEAFHGCAVSLLRLQRGEEALAAFNKAITLQPQLAAVYVGRAALLQTLDRHAEAISDYRKGVALEPSAATHNALATSLLILKQYDDAVAHLDRGIALDPDLEYLPGNRRSTMMWAAMWDGFDEDVTRLAQGIEARKPVSTPLTLSSLSDSAALLRTAAEVWVQNSIEKRVAHSRSQLPALVHGPRTDKIRIAYFSSDLRSHPVAFLTAGLFEHHDRAHFEVTAFAFGPQTQDPIVERLVSAFDRFIDVRQKTDLEVVRLARELGIDIAIDLNGYTAHERSGIFALRAAPIQVSFLGFPGTLGAAYMDYLIADPVVVPPELQVHYVEQIAYLPDSFMPFDSRYQVADRSFTRAQQGLPANAVVFCCFNSSNKIIPEVFACWMRILQATGNSVLWLQRADATVAGNLRRHAAVLGIHPDRLIFAQRMETVAEHLARLRLADLFLDTFPYNAHSTAVDSLRAGVPLLTLASTSFASRVAASLLHSVGLPELIADSREQYEAMAIELARDPPRRDQLRQKLSESRTSLFDTAQYTRNLETLFSRMVELYQSGAPPTHIGCPVLPRP